MKMKKCQLEAKIEELEKEKLGYQTGNWIPRIMLEFSPIHILKKIGVNEGSQSLPE